MNSSSKFLETINIYKNYKLINARDPYSGKVYNIKEAIEKKLIDFERGYYRIESTNELVNISNAIADGYINACLVDESMESYCEYVTSYDKNNNNNINSNNQTRSIPVNVVNNDKKTLNYDKLGVLKVFIIEIEKKKTYLLIIYNNKKYATSCFYANKHFKIYFFFSAFFFSLC